MRIRQGLISFCMMLTIITVSKKLRAQDLEVVFYGDTIKADTAGFHTLAYNDSLSIASIRFFYDKIKEQHFEPLIQALQQYKEQHALSDWIYYQLIRKTAQQLSPKEKNYNQYTLYKWFLLAGSGYDARLAIIADDLLFYAQTDENIYDIPSFKKDGKQFVCLNYHDFGSIDFTKGLLLPVEVIMPGAEKKFSYKVNSLPALSADSLTEKDLRFNYHNKNYQFKIVLNPDVPVLFRNYPVTDFASYFNIPMSAETYNSLLPVLKKAVSKMSMEKGVDYLMEFTRNAFLYENDQENFGKEKRLSPEMVLFSKYSDCDDRAALFFYLVKEIYNRPMLVLLYPTHVTIAVRFDKVIGKPVYYNNNAYSICDPTPQGEDLPIGSIAPKYKNEPYTVAYEYHP